MQTSAAGSWNDGIGIAVTLLLLAEIRGRRVDPDERVLVAWNNLEFIGQQRFVAGRDFGDFVVWRNDGVPSYQLAVVVDDAAMQITEIVRGADLLLSTARQLLLYRTLGVEAPAFFHCPLLTDSTGARLAKRHDALSLRTLRSQGTTPEDLQNQFALLQPERSNAQRRPPPAL